MTAQTIVNHNAVQLITNALTTGLMHPGDDNNPPYALQLSIFKTTGLPTEEADRVTAITQQVAEAIINTLETDNEILPKPEVEQLRRTAADRPTDQGLEVRCTCGAWLFTMAIRNGDLNNPTVNGQAIIKAMQAMSPQCALGHKL
jgi:hypothetical protein